MLCRRCRRRWQYRHFDDTAALAREHTIYPHEVAPAKTADRNALHTCFTQTFQRGFGSFEMFEAAVTLGSGIVIYVYHIFTALILKILHEYRHRFYEPLRQSLPKISARLVPSFAGTFLTSGHNSPTEIFCWFRRSELFRDTPAPRIRGDVGAFQSSAFVTIDRDRRYFARNFPRCKEAIQRGFRVFEVKKIPVACLSVQTVYFNHNKLLFTVLQCFFRSEKGVPLP